MTALRLLDANGDPVTCASVDVAGDPTTLTNPVVVLQDDGTFILAAPPPVAYGPTNYSYIDISYNPDVYLNSASYHFPTDPTVDGILTALPDNRIQVVSSLYAEQNDEISDGAHLTMVRSPIPDGVDETDDTEVWRNTTHYFESGTPLELQVFGAAREIRTDEAIPTSFELGYSIMLLEFDSIIANPTTETWDTTGATITDMGTVSTYMIKTKDAVDLYGVHFEAVYTPDFARGLAEEGADGYDKTAGTYIPVSVSGDKSWVLTTGNYTIDGAAWNPENDPSSAAFSFRQNIFEV